MNDAQALRTARLHSLESVMERLGVGRSKVFELISAGEIRSVKVGRRRLVSESAIVEFVERLDATAEAASGFRGRHGLVSQPQTTQEGRDALDDGGLVDNDRTELSTAAGRRLHHAYRAEIAKEELQAALAPGRPSDRD